MKRLTTDRVVLKKGESQRKNGTYLYRYNAGDGTRKSVYAKTLEELRNKEEQIDRDMEDGIKPDVKTSTLNDIFELWCDIKKGLKDNTYQNYKYMYDTFVRNDIGNRKIQSLVKSDIKRFYNRLVDERGLKVSTVDSIHTVLHQVIGIAADDNIIRNNIADNTLKELKKIRNTGEKRRRALTIEQQKLFLEFLKESETYRHWYPIFAVMTGTGMRVGEITGLRWCDIFMEENEIDINHTLVYYNHAQNGCYFSVNTPKTEAGRRKIYMMEQVKKAFREERKNQIKSGVRCNVSVDGYTDFVFVNRFGNVQHQGTLNKALRRIIRDCNAEVMEKYKGKGEPVLLPQFSCHSLRHTYATRLCEANVNIKVIQEQLGHKDIRVTMDIYAEATKHLKKSEMQNMEIEKANVWVV